MSPPPAATTAGYDVLDEALARLAFAGPELRNTFSNHAPMAIEALCAHGRGDAALPWLERYRSGFLPRPAATARITEADWRSALGNLGRFGDWFAFFQAELAEASWRDVVGRWVPRLAPGIVAAAMHGVLRAGHAARALAHGETAERRRELADGLAYWAADHQSLPSGPRRTAPAAPSAAIGRVERMPPTGRGTFDSLTGALTQLDRFPPFRDVLHAVDPAPDVEAFLSDLTATFARVYLANARDPLTTIAFVHGVTGPAALRPLLPHLDTDAGRTALACAWQASAALYATFGTAPPAAGPGDPAPPHRDELFDRAIATGDEHAIKFTAACLDEHARTPDPVFLLAADHAIGALRAAG
jgi:hypothetical protein